jgi:ubiquinone/menaquinone biosynthesis C-methylase UbiE
MKSKNILWVEDKRVSEDFINKINGDGHEFILALNEDEALFLMDRQRFDLVIFDIMCFKDYNKSYDFDSFLNIRLINKIIEKEIPMIAFSLFEDIGLEKVLRNLSIPFLYKGEVPLSVVKDEIYKILNTKKPALKLINVTNNKTNSYIKNDQYSLLLQSVIRRRNLTTYLKLRQERKNEANSKSLIDIKIKLKDMLTDKEIINWLDVGCGDGRCLDILEEISKKESVQYLGIDINEEYLKQAKEFALIKGLKADFMKMDASKMRLDKKFDIISVILFFHEINPICLPHILRNIIDALDAEGTIIISDFQEPYEQEKGVIIWTMEDIKYVLDNICDTVKMNIEIVPSDICKEELFFYRGFVKKPKINPNRFKIFVDNYAQFIERKRSDSQLKLENYGREFDNKVFDILNVQNINTKDISEEQMEKIVNEMDLKYKIKAFKIDSIENQVPFLNDKLISFKSGIRCNTD